MQQITTVKQKEKTWPYVNREISWLAFNERVLQEAADNRVPLLSRIQFLGIFSNNLDEFFRVRVASLRRVVQINKEVKIALGFSPKKILKQIRKTVVKQQKRFEAIYADIRKELADNQIFIINEKQLTEEQGRQVKQFFHNKVRPLLVPLMISHIQEVPDLKDGAIYLAAHLAKKDNSVSTCYSLLEIPTRRLSRFHVLEKSNNQTFIILLDDVIRYCLQDIFAIFGYDDCHAYTIKITKDAETNIDNDVSKSFLELMQISIRQRKHGLPVRFIHDQEIKPDLRNFLIAKLNLTKDENVISAGRYHNFKDFMKFPTLEPSHLRVKPLPPLPHVNINPRESLFQLVAKKDIMLCFPYHSYLPIIDFLREAAIDPWVETIKITAYRLAKNSNIINALVNAKQNGKDVTIVLELQARFDEEANIKWAQALQEAGLRVIHGPQNRKVHAKLYLIGRRNRKTGKLERFACIGTGNFNEDTAKVYSDICLLTHNKKITKEINDVFKIMTRQGQMWQLPTFKHLLVSPHDMIFRLYGLIDQEIANAKNGQKAYIIAKLNSLNDEGMIDKLYEASQAGVQIKLMIRGICSLIPQLEGVSENIEAYSIVDRYLEHARIYVFANGGDEIMYLSSADWMERNLRRRIEVACPIYDEQVKLNIRNTLDFQFQDNMKRRIHNNPDGNMYWQSENDVDAPSFSAQLATYEYFKAKVE